ncbi:hypothetical protein J8I26_00645 [Herbaspirillum sp. LeCh32-8]|uniref:hypothetical protein n=1 Tax=Herbaspirillum sp. LeCh32-8 TaxID=2821356 RepID=UPI001AE2CFFC|nr:hypothetical protein [Herbaspirillum sp. LeCh32-8]MBP0596600.1 hypothetical protein [Herbaspirillum sp. LeCh32-8]
MKWNRMAMPVLLAGVTAAHAAGIYVCSEGGRTEYRDDAQAANCRAGRLAPVGVVTAVRPADVAVTTAAPQGDDAARDGLREQLTIERKRIEALRREYSDGEPERRGDERNYAKYQQRTAALKAALEESRAKAAALQQQLNR